jgi:tRNA(Ile)-lysidine synthetase-like protein
MLLPSRILRFRMYRPLAVAAFSPFNLSPCRRLISSVRTGSKDPNAVNSTPHRHVLLGGQQRHASTGNSDTNRNSPNTITVPDRVKEAFCEEILPQIMASIVPPGDDDKAAVVLLVVGVSGGCDSVALLHALEQCRQSPEGFGSVTCLLNVVHFDHQQRGTESDQDRDLVHALCADYNIPCQSYYWQDDHPDMDDQSFSQEKARNWRRSRMRRHLQRSVDEQAATTGVLITAHHKDDSEETLLLKILRGAHLTKWTGMPILAKDCGDDEEDSSSFVGGDDNRINVYWARPLIHARKRELQDFLQQHGYCWREDASNQGNKYLRNRVRNELVPLLQDLLVSGEETFHRRLDTIQEQSRELRKDVSQRAKAFLVEHTDCVDGIALFCLPGTVAEDGVCVSNSPGTILSVVHKEALHMWVVEQVGDASFQFTYDKLQRVCQQLADYPDNRQWRLNIRGGWDIQRQGDCLRVLRTSREGAISNDDALLNENRRPVKFSTDLPGNENGFGDEQKLMILPIAIPKSEALPKIQFYETTSGACRKWTMTPPWRRNSIFLKEFLRGQKIPLHARNSVPVVVLGDAVVAVRVATRDDDKWVVNAVFDAGRADEQPDDYQYLWLKVTA